MDWKHRCLTSPAARVTLAAVTAAFSAALLLPPTATADPSITLSAFTDQDGNRFIGGCADPDMAARLVAHAGFSYEIGHPFLLCGAPSVMVGKALAD